MKTGVSGSYTEKPKPRSVTISIPRVNTRKEKFRKMENILAQKFVPVVQ